MADPRYSAALERYKRTGNLRAVARELDINESSLRDYAKRHDWPSEREHYLAQIAELERTADAGAAGLVKAFYRNPSAKAHATARHALDIRSLLDSAHLEGGATTYDGSRDAFRELTIACLLDARKRGDQKSVRDCLALLGEADGHIGRKEEKKGDKPSAELDLAAIRDLVDPQGAVFTGPEEATTQTG